MGGAGGWSGVRGGSGEHAHFAPTTPRSSLTQVNYTTKAPARLPISTSQVASQGA